MLCNHLKAQIDFFNFRIVSFNAPDSAGLYLSFQSVKSYGCPFDYGIYSLSTKGRQAS